MKPAGLVIALAVLMAGVSAAQEGPREGPREHWERLSPQEQALLRQRFQQLERLDPAQRAELERRHARLLEEEERIIAGLSESARTKLQAMDPERRRQVLLDMAHIELLRRGARLRDKLPPEWVERLEQTPPHERRELMRGYLEGLRGEPGRPPPPRPGMRPPPNGPGPGGGPGRPGGPEGPGGQPGGQRPPLGPPPRLTPETRMALRDLVHPDVEWMIELADLPPFERRRVVETRVRERVLERLRESGELTPEQLTHLESLRGPQFRDAMRRLLGPPPRRTLPEANNIR